MSNSITPVRGTITNPFGSIFSDRFFDSFFNDAPIYGVTRNNRTNNGFNPKFNVQQSETGYTISIAAPGVSKEDINVSVEDNTLNIEIARDTAEKDTDASDRAQIISSHKGIQDYSFNRKISLEKASIETDKITSSYKNGILTITLPKSAVAQPKKIDVKVE